MAGSYPLAERREHRPAGEWEEREEEERGTPRARVDERCEEWRHHDARDRERRLLEADRGAAAPGSRELCRRDEREAVPGGGERGRGDEQWDDDCRPSVEQQRRRGERDKRGETDDPQRTDARAHDVGPSPGSDSGGDREDVRDGKHRRGALRRVAALVVQEENEKREERDLRRDVQAAAAREQPETNIPEGPGHVLRLDAVARQLAHDEDTDQSRRDAEGAEERERQVAPAGVRERGQRERADDAAERNRRLPDPEREAALCRAEPLHHRAPACRLDARSRRAGRRKESAGRDRSVGEYGQPDERSGQAQPETERASLADPVGDEARGKQGDGKAEPSRRQQQAEAREVEPVLRPQRGCDRRQADSDRRAARLRRRPGGEDRPAVAARSYSANGLNGFGLVEWSTLFVSRYCSSVSSPSSRPKPDCL